MNRCLADFHTSSPGSGSSPNRTNAPSTLLWHTDRMPDDVPPLDERREQRRLATEEALGFIMARIAELPTRRGADPVPHSGRARAQRACADWAANVDAMGLGVQLTITRWRALPA